MHGIIHHGMNGVDCNAVQNPRKRKPNRKVTMGTTLQDRLLVTDLLHFTEESVCALDLPFTQLSQRHLLEVNLKTGKEVRYKSC